MRSFAIRKLIAVIGALVACQHAPAQEPPNRGSDRPALLRSAPVPAGADVPVPVVPAPAPGRTASPLESLEALSEGRVAEPGGARSRENERDEIETDRDSFTPATTTAGRNRLIVESAYSFVDNRGIKETHSVPEMILRYGITERIEFRLGWNYEVGGVGNEASGVDAADSDPTRSGSRLHRDYTLAYGTKVRLTDQDRWRPQTVVIVQAFTPTGVSTGGSTATQLIATYAAGWVFPNRWKFDAAIRYGTATEGGDHFNQWAPSAVLKVPIGEKWAAHVEYFGIYTTGKAQNPTQHYISPGLHYLVTSNFEVGFRLGWGLNDQTPRFFSNVGVGWRF
jgi:hypothetical protein